MDDYYSLLGVEPDASTDDIKSAYRERKEAGGGDAARLNKAWNVLSDPYQRGRYDQQRADAIDNGEVLGGDDIEVLPASASNGSSSARGKQAPPRQTRGRRELGPPTIMPPAGTMYPASKPRLVAMATDLFVLFVLVFVVGINMVVPAVAKWQQPAVVDKLNQLSDQHKAQSTTVDNAKKALDTAKNAQPPDQADVTAKQKAYDAEKQKLTDIEDEQKKQSNKLFGVSALVIGVMFVVGLLYLVLPSLTSGATVGKRFQKIKVVREDGSPARFGDLAKRYGLPLLGTYLLILVPLIGLLGGAVMLFFVLRWMQNNNQQGFHDRIAHTIVVTPANS